VQVANLGTITGETAVLTGCLNLEGDFAIQAEDGAFLNFFPVHYPDGYVRKNWSVEFRTDGWYLHTSCSVLNGKVECPFKAQLCMELVRGSLEWTKGLRLISRICRGDISKITTTMRMLQNAGLITGTNREE
jgi:hypothetical protein